jgi:glycerol-3-phosphate acyltransferase PlsY
MPSLIDLEALGWPLTGAAAGCYLLGSLPFGYLVARSRGVNIFEVGSRSPGATNVRRVLGKGPGNTVFGLDMLKGAVAAGWPLAWFYFVLARKPAEDHPATLADCALMGYLGLAFALVGHSFSCFTGFKGGKGVATAAGGFLVLLPYVALISAAVWVAVFYATRFVSLASILAALILPFLSVGFGRGRLALAATILTAVFVVVRHRANVGRLLAGTEKRFERKKASEDGKDGP